MASEEQEALTTNGLKTILQWEIHPLGQFTKYVSVLHVIREREISS